MRLNPDQFLSLQLENPWHTSCIPFYGEMLIGDAGSQAHQRIVVLKCQ